MPLDDKELYHGRMVFRQSTLPDCGCNGYWIQDANLLSVSYAVGGLQVSGTWVGVKIDPFSFSLLAYGRVSQRGAKLGKPGRRDCGSLQGLLSCAFIQVHRLCRFMMVPDVLFPFQCIVRTVLAWGE